jgi:hypothetical protein
LDKRLVHRICKALSKLSKKAAMPLKKNEQRADIVAEVVECLSSKHEDLSSNPGIVKKKNNKILEQISHSSKHAYENMLNVIAFIGLQIKTTMKYRHTPVRVVKFK